MPRPAHIRALGVLGGSAALCYGIGDGVPGVGRDGVEVAVRESVSVKVTTVEADPYLLSRSVCVPTTLASRTPVREHVDNRLDSVCVEPVVCGAPGGAPESDESGGWLWRSGTSVLASLMPGTVAFAHGRSVGGGKASFNAGALRRDLVKALGRSDAVSVDEEECTEHGLDKWSYHSGPPATIVVYPRTTEEVSQIVKLCNKYRAPIIPYGGGTSLEGATTSPDKGGSVCIDMNEMDSIVELRDGDLDITVQPGIGWQDLNARLAPSGLFFPVDPGPGATIGGMVATGCSGTNAVRYGTMRQNVLALTVVMADGSIMKTRQRSRKSTAGYDLTSLIVGSEGTLGIVTEAVLKLVPVPESEAIAVCNVPNLRHASDVVGKVMRKGITPRCVELLDEEMMKGVNAYAGFSYPETPHLFFKFSGRAETVKSDAEVVRGIVKQVDGASFEWAADADTRAKLWEARKGALWAALNMRPGTEAMITDVCVPLSALPEAIAETQDDIRRSPLAAPIVGHVGDGNFHCVILIHPDDEAEVAEAQRLNDRMVRRAIRLGGSCTGEHGVGVGKMKFLQEELGEANLDVMRTIKRALDPHNLMNPGKLVPKKK